MRQRRRAWECELCGKTGPVQLFVLVNPDADEAIVCKRCNRELGDLVSLEEAVAAKRSAARLRSASR